MAKLKSSSLLLTFTISAMILIIVALASNFNITGSATQTDEDWFLGTDSDSSSTTPKSSSGADDFGFYEGDKDRDGIPDETDPDIDGDGYLNDWELANGLNPTVANKQEPSKWCGLPADKLKEYESYTQIPNTSPIIKMVLKQEGDTVNLDLRGSVDTNSGDRIRKFVVVYDYLGDCRKLTKERYSAILDDYKDVLSSSSTSASTSDDEEEDMESISEVPVDADVNIISGTRDYLFEHTYDVPSDIEDYSVKLAVFAFDTYATKYFCADYTGIALSCKTIEFKDAVPVATEEDKDTETPAVEEEDSDEDGILDEDDACPDEYVSKSKDKDKDGCEDELTSSLEGTSSGTTQGTVSSGAGYQKEESKFPTTVLIIIIIVAVVMLLLLYLYKQGKLPFGGGGGEQGGLGEGEESSGGGGEYFQ